MARYNLDEIISKNKKKRYDLDEIMTKYENQQNIAPYTPNTQNIQEIAPVKTAEVNPQIEQGLQQALNNKNLTKEQRQNILATLNNYKANPTVTMESQNRLDSVAQQGGISNVIKNNGQVDDIEYLEKELGIKNTYLQKSNAFKDGYNFGDVTKTILGTLGDVGVNTVKGIANIGEGIGDLGSYGIAAIADATGNKDYADRVRANAQVNLVDKYMAPVANAVDKNSVLANNSDSMVQSLGYVAGMTSASIIGGAAGGALGMSTETAATVASTATTFSSSMGHGMTEAYKEGANDDEAFKYGLIAGIAEAGSELLFGGLGKASGAVGLSKSALPVDDALAKKVSSVFKSQLAKNLAEFTIKAGAEGAEEVLSGFLQAVGKKFTYMKEEDFWDLVDDQHLLEQFVAGAITSAIAQSPSLVKTTRNGQNFIQEEAKSSPELIKKGENKQEQQSILNENKTAQNGNIEGIEQIAPIKENNVENNQEIKKALNRNGNFSEQIDKYMSGKLPSGDFLYLGETPKVLQSIGLTNNEIILKQNKLKALMEESYDNTDRLHGLSADTIKKLPEAISNPLNILKSSSNENSVVIVTDLADTYERPIIVSIEMDYEGQIGKINFLSNRLTSAYGKNNYDRFMKTEIEKGNLLYDIDEGIIKELPTTRLQLPKGISSSVDTNNNVSTSNNSITHSNENVNQYNDMQNSENNTYNKPTRHEVIQENRKIARENVNYNNIQKNTNVEKYNNYKKNIINSKESAVNNLISYKNETMRSIDERIAEKQKILNSKTNKDTKTASTIKNQIENLKTQKSKIENLYNEKIDKYNTSISKEKIELETRNMMKQDARNSIKAEIDPLIQDLTQYKDKKAGILYNRETAQRNIDDIVKNKELANSIKETIFDPVQVHQAEKTREINRLMKKINELDLDKTKKYSYIPKNGITRIKVDEATLAQLIIEKKINDTDLRNYGIDNAGIEKIHKTANTFTEILEELYNKMNDEQIKYGYSPIGKIENYFPHFLENKPDKTLGKIASYFGIDLTNQELPTEIAGKTDTFKPGRTWDSNIQKRMTNKTDYNALTAMERYIKGAAELIYTTEDIQKVREYSRQIRYKFSDKGIQTEIDNIMNNNELTQEAKDLALDGIFKNTENELSNFVTWLDDYANTLAGKKSFSDRNMEHNIGRNMYKSMAGIESRIAANTIGGNVSVSLTNLAPIFQAAGTTKWNYLLTGMLQTTQNDIKGIVTNNKDTSFVSNSNFLTNRFGTDSIANKKLTQKMSKVASVPMNAIDEFTAESIVRAKYLENIDKGMTEERALDSADKYAAKIMADRSNGALPLIFNSKNPLAKLVTMFQVEPNNILSNYLKDMPRDTESKTQLIKQYTKLMAASYAFNSIIMAIRGGNEVLPDPIRWVSYLIKSIVGDDDEKEKAKTDLAESVLGSLPYVSNLAGFVGMEDIGRIPISNAMPNITNLVKLADSEADSKYKQEIALKEFSKPLLYLGLPVGGAQINKTINGISTVVNGGSYKTNKKGEKELQFPVENANVGKYIKAGLFGKYSLSDSKLYADRGYKALSAKQTKMYEESNIPYKELLDYLDAGLTKIDDKISYVSEKDMTTEQKWGIYTNDIFSKTERKDGGSQLSDANYIISNGISKKDFIDIYNKAQKNNIDIPTADEYKEMKKNGISLDKYIEYKIAVKNKTNEKRKSGELKDTQDLKNTDKIQILLDSKYSNKEIKAIYENYIKSKEDSEYDIINKTNINIKEYLKYKQQDFSSDKKDDGTTTGKTVSGSSKIKVYQYVNSMNITYEQRLMLLGMKYSLSSTEKTNLYNYVKSLNCSQNEMQTIFEKLKGFTVYKNGKVTW